MSSSKIISALTQCSMEILLKLIVPFPYVICSYFFTSFTHLKSAFQILLHNQFSFSPMSPIDRHIYGSTLGAGSRQLFKTARHAPGSTEQCAVCLGEVAGGDEVGELRCRHVFHELCLRSWVRFSQHTSCPLCRGALNPRLLGSRDKVIFFKFGYFADDTRHRDSWWLR